MKLQTNEIFRNSREGVSPECENLRKIEAEEVRVGRLSWSLFADANLSPLPRWLPVRFLEPEAQGNGDMMTKLTNFVA